MVSDDTYEICLPILNDQSLDEEERIDKVEELLRKETTLVGKPLESAILDILWRHRDATTKISPVLRHNVLRRPSPAPWQIPRVASATPFSSSPRLGVSPLAPPGFLPHSFNRTVSSTASPFTSPRPSPRLAFSSPAIPHSPSLNAYQFPAHTSPSQDIYGDYGSDNVDWIVNDDAISVTSSIGGTSSFNATAGEFVPSASASAFQPQQQNDMSPYDILRSILGPSRSDDEIENALTLHGYDLSATIMALMDAQDTETAPVPLQENNIPIGKKMDMQRPVTPAGQQKSSIVCRFWLSTGQCLRADCRFSHDLSNHICKYWVMGNCLAGDTCMFSHDPSHFMNQLSLEGSETPPTQSTNLQYQDYNSYPALQSSAEQQWDNQSSTSNTFQSYPPMGYSPQPGFKSLQDYNSDNSNSRSRPTSRQRPLQQATLTPPIIDDNEAFPSLGAMIKPAKKHHGKRGGHNQSTTKDASHIPSSLADVVKMSPSPGPEQLRNNARKLVGNSSSVSMNSGENSAAAQAIPPPQHIPWLETGVSANKAYLKARQDAIKHGGLRNKFLQSAAQAWNRNDARAAKALSLRGQSENDLMRKAHREAAALLYESRNSSPLAPSMHRQDALQPEIYVDLHGLHPEEAVEYLERVLLEHSQSERSIYAITGTGHHSKNGKDKVGKAIRGFLNEWRYAFREFSVPGDRNNVGGILGIDARSCAKEKSGAGRHLEQELEVDILDQGHEIGDGKIRMLVRDQSKAKSQ